MSDLVTVKSSEFVTPSAKVELNGELGLTLHEVAKSLGIEFKHAKEKFKVLEKANDIIAVGYTAVTNSPMNPTVESYVMLIDEAKFFVTQYANAVGKAYCRYLIQAEKQNTERGKFITLLMSDRIIAERFVTLAEQDNAKVETLQIENARLVERYEDCVENDEWKSAMHLWNTSPHLQKDYSPKTLGRALTKLGSVSGSDVRKVPHSRWGSINIYHKSLFDNFNGTLTNSCKVISIIAD